MGAHQLQKGADYFASRAAERRGAWKSLLIGIGVLAAFIAAQIVATAALTAVGVELSVTRLDLPRAIATIAFELITLACAWPLVRPLGGRRAAAVGDPRARMRPGLWMVAPITLLVVGAPALLAALGDDRLIAKHLGLGEAVALVALAVIISVTEELWFRGLLIAGLGGEQRPWLSIMASALLFALPHFSGDRASLANAASVLLAIGIPFACVRLLTHTLVPLIVCHAIVDAWAFLHTATIQPAGAPTNGEIVAGLVGPALIAFGYVLAFMLSVRRRARVPVVST